MHTRQTVVENLPPYVVEHYDEAMDKFVGQHTQKEGLEEIRGQFRLAAMLDRLSQDPQGYDFLFPYQDAQGERIKKVSVLWGDADHQTVCLVRADVTEMLEAERRTKKTLENALIQAEEANRAKSDFVGDESRYPHADERDHGHDGLGNGASGRFPAGCRLSKKKSPIRPSIC